MKITFCNKLNKKITSKLFSQNYLRRFGYYDEPIDKLSKSDPGKAFNEAIKQFQLNFASFGLKPTGILDKATRQLMNTERCGVSDVTSNTLKQKNGKSFHGNIFSIVFYI